MDEPIAGAGALTRLLDELPATEEPLHDDPVVHRAVLVARALQRRGSKLQTPGEKRQQAELERMMTDPRDRVTLTQLTDQAFRSHRASRAADQLIHILDVQGVPRFFGVLDRAMLKGFQSFGGYLPGVSMPMVRDKMREETANVILPAEEDLLCRHLEQRRAHGLRMNVNYLGEALLGEDEAQRRFASYLAALQLEQIEVISVKISTIYSQITAISRDDAVTVLCDRLELLYRAAARERFRRPDGREVAKLVYLDMEEYRDLAITLDAFMKTLDRPGLEKVDAGIALQAYLPDSFAAQRRITEWALERLQRGGSPVTLRIVKGANMEMERVSASIGGWEQATFQNKRDTDASYKRMLRYGLHGAHLAAVRVGVATHNLFEVAYALVLAHDRGVLEQVQFEMLEGMANHQRRALSELTDDVLLYAPATRKEEFVNAIGYLLRRLDENTGPENFLRYAFKIEVGSRDWEALERAFLASFDHIGELPEGPRRTQDRTRPVEGRGTPMTLETFVNEPDTDFSLERNVRWAESIVAAWRERHGDAAPRIPLVIDGEDLVSGEPDAVCLDPSRPGFVVGRYRQATEAELRRALRCAKDDDGGWRSLDEANRQAILADVAQELRRARGDLMGAAMAEGGKIFTESDPEVSEAIDFVQLYAASARAMRELPYAEASPKGVVAVIPPWNFPIAIPCGGIAAALAAGNCVILKPASHTVLIAWELCKCFWRAGVPKAALQLLPCAGAKVGNQLVLADEVDVVILTGGTSTALRMLDQKPSMGLLAETGGKNATIVTGMADREQAIAHVLHSAFSHSGQKCSATSLLILEGEVYDDPQFKATLCDAVRSRKVGSAWDLSTRMGPLIRPPSGDLDKAIKELEPGESWAVMPRRVGDNPSLYTPGVKWGVRPGSYTHMTELFGPVLAVMRARDLHEAIDLAVATGYGLTAGIETLDEREQEIWRESMRAGNLYINRVTTGAVVMRQPFGGVGKSCFGPGIKAGGPSYVAQLMEFTDRPRLAVPQRPVRDAAIEQLRLFVQTLLDAPRDSVVQAGLPASDVRRILAAIVRYDEVFAEEIGVEHDHVRLVGQDNIRRYRPVRSLRVRVHPDDTAFDLFARVCAARTVGCGGITVSSPVGLSSPALTLLDELTESWAAGVELVEESDAQLVEAIRAGHTDRVRYAAPERAPEAVLRGVGDSGVYVARAPVLVEGRVELLWYVTEQSVSHDYHRYGNLGDRAGEPRRPVP